MNPRKSRTAEDRYKQAVFSSVEDILERRLEEIATILSGEVNRKSRLYEDVISMTERSLFRIALKRSNHIKSAAASYLGINRNTFQNKMIKLGINCNDLKRGK